MLRDAGEETGTGTKSVRNSSTVMMHVMGVGTVVDPIGALVLQTSSDVIAAITTQIAGNAAAGVIIATTTTLATGVVAARAFLTPFGCIRIMTCPAFADVAELADAQVSEACDGDIVEVQVLSSSPKNQRNDRSYISYRTYFSFKNNCHGFSEAGV